MSTLFRRSGRRSGTRASQTSEWKDHDFFAERVCCQHEFIRRFSACQPDRQPRAYCVVGHPPRSCLARHPAGEHEGLPTVAKIPYVGLAHLVGVKVAVGDTFKEVRQLILEGKPEGVTRFFTHKRYLEACQQGPHQHSIAIAARRDRHRLDAIVRVFGELTYFALLSDHYYGADFCTTLVYDAYRGEKNEMLFAHEQAEILQMENVATSPETVWGDLEGFGRNYCVFLERMMEQKRLKDIAAKKLAAKAQADPGREGPIN